MTLRNIHDFELSLYDPLIKMTERGVLVDEERRLRMLKELKESVSEVRSELQNLVAPYLQPGIRREKLFKHRWVCKCCRNGSKKKLACWSCGGYKKQPGKSALLFPCRECKGEGSREWYSFNEQSPEQCKIVLYNLLKLPKRTKKGSTTTDEEALKSLLSHDTSGVVASLLKLHKVDTIAEIYERIGPGGDGRIRTVYNPAGTEIGRLNSTGTFLEASTNLQNLPKREAVRSPLYNVRGCLIADKGEVLMEGDLSGADARVVAALSGDEELLARWEDPSFDVHRWTASLIFNVPEEEVTYGRRILGKEGRHAGNYGVGGRTLTRRVNANADLTGVSITVAQGNRIIVAYRRLHPVLETWWEQVARRLDREGKHSTCFGRLRTFFARRSNPCERLGPAHKEAIPYEPAATVADLANRGLLRWWNRHDPHEGRLLLQTHDSVTLTVPKARVTRAAKLLKNCMEEEIEVNGYKLTIPCEVSVGRNWGEMEEL